MIFSRGPRSGIIGPAMEGPPIRIRRERPASHRRPTVASRALVVAVTAAALAAATLLRPGAASAPVATNLGQPTPAAAPTTASSGVAFAAPASTPAAKPAIPTLAVPKPAVPAPAPVVAPAPVADGTALLAGLRADLGAQWLRNHRETDLHAGPSDDSAKFNTLPQWTLLKQMETRGDWTLVYYSGDGATRQPGPGWVHTADVGGVGTPTVWLNAARQTTLWSAGSGGSSLVAVDPRALMEVLTDQPISGTRVHVRLPGDGKQTPPSTGWIEGGDLARQAAPASWQLPWGYPNDLKAEVRLQVPYRTQLDGSDYAEANCGPTALGMALDALGVSQPPATLRQEVLTAQDMDPNDTDAGSYIWALSAVAQQNGIKTVGLFEPDGKTFHRWSVDDVRAELRNGRPVIVQVRYRFLPRRQDSLYYGDHYVVITGLLGDSFLYNDPIWGRSDSEGVGYDRVISADQLRRAMNASDTDYAYTAFALAGTTGRSVAWNTATVPSGI